MIKESDNPGSKTPRYEKLAATFREKINDHTWPAGSRIPSRRALAAEYGESEDVVMNACNMLFREHLLEIRSRKGAYVSSLLIREAVNRNLAAKPGYEYQDFSEPEQEFLKPVKRAAVRLDLSSPRPDEKMFQRMKKYYNSMPPPDFPGGCAAVKEAIIECIRPGLVHRGIALADSQFCIAEGEFTILHHIASVLRGGHDGVFVLPASFNPVTVRAIRSAGLEVKTLDCNSWHDCFVSLDRLARQYCIRGVFLEPRCGNGTGCLFPDKYRDPLFGLAEARRFPVIEIDYDHEFSYASFRPLFADAPEYVIYVSCVSKLANVLYDVKYAAGPLTLIRSLKSLSENCSRAAECRLATVKRIIEQRGMEDAARSRAERCRDAASLLRKYIRSALASRINVVLPSAGTAMFLEMPPGTDGQKLRQLLFKENIHIRKPVLKTGGGRERKVLRLDCSDISADQAGYIAGKFITAFERSTSF